MKKIIVGISAADGVQIGVRLLKLLREIPDVETHLVMSRNADTNLRLELAHLVKDVLPEVNAGGDLGEDHPAVDQTEHRAFGYEQDLLMGILRKL